MFTISGYKALEKIHEEPCSLYYRAVKIQDNRTVVLKVLKQGLDLSAFTVRCRHDMEISSLLNIRSVVKPCALERHEGLPVMVLEDFGGIAVKRLISQRKFSMDELISLSLKAAGILDELHKKHIIHKNINSSCFIFNAETGQLKISDFGIATELMRDVAEVSGTDIAEGSLAYISPEQTGRMNRCMDYRTDIYSLGVTIYEWFTGRLPFESDDPLELVHCHIAKWPAPPHEVDTSIPVQISRIIMKLLSKSPENRYQSASGLKADMEECCRKSWETGHIEDFQLGRFDIYEKLVIPEKLYGRKQEAGLLLGAFDRASRGRLEIFLVSGDPGIGKSALVNEVRKPITLKKGYFISGKFDQLNRHIAYSAIIQAFRDLMRQLLGESEQRLDKWRMELLQAFGPNSRIIIDMIPEMELIIGSQPPVRELGPIETRNRFNMVFQDFLKVFPRKEQPLALFLDDLQWADSASLELMGLIAMDNETRHFFLIGAYRSNEVNGMHPVMTTINQIREAGITVHNITLPPLDKADINRLVADTLKSSAERSGALAKVLYKKTEGNPFFTKVFLQSLHEEKILSFTHDIGWQWGMDEIGKMDATENVVRLMTQRINSLSDVSREMLKLASCLGNTFNIEYLMIVTGKAGDVVMSEIQAALNAGMILKHTKNTYRFVHDRIQEAAYSLIPDESKQAVHLRIGRLLLDSTAEGELDGRLFVIVGQLNAGDGLMDNDPEKIRLSELNLKAGKKAKASAAFEEALRYFNTAADLLPRNSWDDSFELTLDIYVEKAEAEYLNTNFDSAEYLFDLILARTTDPVKQTRIHELRIDFYTTQNKPLEAVDVGIKALAMLGVRLPKETLPSVFLGEIQMIRESIGKKEIRDLINLPDIADPGKVAAIRILLHTWPSAYVGVPELVPLLVTKMINLSLEHGNAPASSLAYSTYGALLAGVLMEFDSAYEFGLLSRSLMDKFNAIDIKCRIFFNFAVLINHWKNSIRSGLPYLVEGYRDGFRTGDLQFASYSINHHQVLSIFAGEKLDDIEIDFDKLYPLMVKAKQEDAILWFNMFRQFVLNLQGKSEGKLKLRGHYFDEDASLEVWIKANNMTTLSGTYIMKTIVCYLYGDYAGAFDYAMKAEKEIKGVTGMVFVPIHNFFYSLTLAALCKDATKPEQRNYLEQINKNQESMFKWAENSPENYRCKHLLVEAAVSCIVGRDKGKPERYCNLAVTIAADNENLFDEALANELAAKYLLEFGNKRLAGQYIAKSINTYKRWGAGRKVEDLMERYGDLIQSPPEHNPTSETGSASHAGVSELLDLTTVIKASQAISSEINHDRLIAKMMEIIIENAGAQRGVLLLEKGSRLYIEASVSVDSERVEVLEAVPLDNSPDISEGIIRQVFRTGENVLLNNATEQGPFIYDPYIVQNRPRSILCTPIRHKDKVMGVLYLENNLSTDVFTRDRIELLNILLSQAAISLENARLFQERRQTEAELERHHVHLEDLVKERTMELETKTEELRKSKQTLIYLLEDVNEVRANLEEANEKLKELDRLKSMFIASMSHELRTPLNSIIGFTGIILQGLVGEINYEQKDQLQRVYGSAKHLLALITDVIDISKIEAGKVAVYAEEFTVDQIIGEAVSSLKSVIDNKGLDLELSVPPDIRLNTDRRRLLQCILNYLSNAIKFTENGALRISARQVPGSEKVTAEDCVEISVTDTGIGISDGDLPKLFNSFVRLDSPLKTTIPGTGLGLYLTKKLATEVLGGSVSVESKCGQGSTFALRIPKEL